MLATGDKSRFITLTVHFQTGSKWVTTGCGGGNSGGRGNNLRQLQGGGGRGNGVGGNGGGGGRGNGGGGGRLFMLNADIALVRNMTGFLESDGDATCTFRFLERLNVALSLPPWEKLESPGKTTISFSTISSRPSPKCSRRVFCLTPKSGILL